MSGILLPQLIRPNLDDRIFQRHTESLAWMHQRMPKGSRIIVDADEYPSEYTGENYWARFARMRQAQIDRHLMTGDDWVFWIDADIVDFPEDLFYRLEAVSESRHALVAPLILIENTHTNYDTAGTRPSYIGRSSANGPWDQGAVEMFSVGGCVLVPAEVHRRVRFEAQLDDDTTHNTEWTSICVGARELGYKSVWDTDTVVRHANLPDYGESFH